MDNKNIKEPSLITSVDDLVSTDIPTDLKNGIYNLFISLLNHYIVESGPEHAIFLATQYLDELSLNFKNIININKEDNNNEK